MPKFSGPAVDVKQFNVQMFAERLRVVMAKRKMTKGDLEKKAGISRQVIWQWEKGNYFPRMFTVQCIAGALDVPVEWLLDPKPVELW